MQSHCAARLHTMSFIILSIFHFEILHSILSATQAQVIEDVPAEFYVSILSINDQTY